MHSDQHKSRSLCQQHSDAQVLYTPYQEHIAHKTRAFAPRAGGPGLAPTLKSPRGMRAPRRQSQTLPQPLPSRNIMPSSPVTPSRRRRSSGFSMTLTRSISQTSVGSNQQRTHSRKSSMQSVGSPRTPRPGSAMDRGQELGLIGELRDGAAAGNGLGSLADELAEEEWYEDGEGEEEFGGLMQGQTGVAKENTEPRRNAGHSMPAATLSPAKISGNGSAWPIKKSQRRHSDCDGSDYGDSDDLEEIQGISVGLESRMAAIESLARQGTGNWDLEGKDVFSDVTQQLRDLSSQANVETHIIRYVACLFWSR